MFFRLRRGKINNMLSQTGIQIWFRIPQWVVGPQIFPGLLCIIFPVLLFAKRRLFTVCSSTVLRTTVLFFFFRESFWIVQLMLTQFVLRRCDSFFFRFLKCVVLSAHIRHGPQPREIIKIQVYSIVCNKDKKAYIGAALKTITKNL